MHYCYMADLISVCLVNHNIIHSKQLVSEQIETVKTASSILTISNVLNLYNVKTEVYYSDIASLNKDKRQAITYLKIGGGRFVLLKKIDSKRNVQFYDPVIDKHLEISMLAFLKLWNNIMIYTISDFSENSLKKKNNK